jgi:dCMP deaminase
MNKWDQMYIDLANFVSKWSKDTSTKTGAVITDSDNRVISIGYNGFPTGVNDDIKERYEKPIKYMYTEHAERNAIYHAAKNGISLKGGTMYIMWFPCSACARAIIQSGISKLVCHEPDLTIPKWGEEFKVSLELLTEAKNFEIVYV